MTRKNFLIHYNLCYIKFGFAFPIFITKENTIIKRKIKHHLCPPLTYMLLSASNFAQSKGKTPFICKHKHNTTKTIFFTLEKNLKVLHNNIIL